MTPDRGMRPTRPAACIACADGVPLCNVMADRQDLPDLWMHQYGGDPGTLSPCKALLRESADRRQDAATPPACTCGQGNVWGYPYSSGHSQGCPYRLAMAQADAKRKATS